MRLLKDSNAYYWKTLSFCDIRVVRAHPEIDTDKYQKTYQGILKRPSQDLWPKTYRPVQQICQ